MGRGSAERATGIRPKAGGNVQGDAAGTAAELLQKGVCTADHGQGPLGARPRRENNVTAGDLPVERMRLNRRLPT